MEEERVSSQLPNEFSKKRDGLSKSLKWFYGIGDFGFTMMSNMETYYFNFFLTNIAMFALPVVTTITTIASLVDAALSWVYGIILNKVKPRKWGRYRSWLVIAPWVVPFLYTFQFIKIGNDTLAAVIIIVGLLSSHIVWNFAFVANISLMNFAAKTPSDRMQLSSTRGAWTALGSVVFSYVGPGTVALFAVLVTPVNAYAATAFTFGVLMVVTYFVHFKMFAGYEETGTEEISRIQREQTAAETKFTQKKGTLGAILRSVPLWTLMFADFLRWAAYFLNLGILVYYFTYVANNVGLMALYILISSLIATVAAYAAKPISDKLTARTTSIFGYICSAVLYVFAFLLYDNVWAVMILASCAYFFINMLISSNMALYLDCAIFSKFKTSSDSTGVIMGLSNAPLKIGIVFRGILITALLAAVGFNAALIDPATTPIVIKQGISAGLALIPGIMCALGALLLLFGFRLRQKDITGFEAKIAEREAAE